MKQCHLNKLKCQDELPDALRQDWLKWVKQLQNLDQVLFPRYVPLNERTPS